MILQEFNSMNFKFYKEHVLGGTITHINPHGELICIFPFKYFHEIIYLFFHGC